MKKALLITLSVAVLSGCSETNLRAPVGEEVIWSSHAEKPKWTVASSPSIRTIAGKEENKGDEVYYQFLGLSQKHGSERLSREMAVADASANAIQYARQLVEKRFESKLNSSSKETETSNGDVNIEAQVKIESIGILEHMAVKDLYIEQWKSGAQAFFKTYALVEIPKKDIERIRTNSQATME